ncbi:MAG TPA: hypothetical protein VFZ61_09035 [Polyangiales bacterium]
MQRSSSHLRNVSADPRALEPITEPSGPGAFAEAMRELIDDLAVDGDGLRLAPANTPSTRRARHLWLVR